MVEIDELLIKAIVEIEISNCIFKDTGAGLMREAQRLRDELAKVNNEFGSATADWPDAWHRVAQLKQQCGEEYRETLRLRKALTQIAKWELPSTGEFWDRDSEEPVSYEAKHGSNGARNYIRNIAQEALTRGTKR